MCVQLVQEVELMQGKLVETEKRLETMKLSNRDLNTKLVSVYTYSAALLMTLYTSLSFSTHAHRVRCFQALRPVATSSSIFKMPFSCSDSNASFTWRDVCLYAV